MLNLSDFELYNNNSDASLHNNYRYRFAMTFERVDDPKGMTLYLQRNWHHSITVSVIYFAAIKALQWAMRSRKAFQLRGALVVWNCSLALFSAVGFVRFTEDLVYSLVHEGLYESLCYSVHPNDVAAYWSLLFAMSKVIELGDTLFIVLRKKPLIFLHYYHHAAVLIYTVHSGAEHTAAGRAFISMNYFVHSLMYAYYASTAYGLRPARWISMSVTVLQTLQMLIGVHISLYVYRIKREGKLPCQQSMGNLYLAFVIYVTFAALFIHFFVRNYLRRPKKDMKTD